VNVCLATRLTGGVGVYVRTLIKALLTAEPTLTIDLVTPDTVDLPRDLASRVSTHPVFGVSALPTHPGWIATALAFRRVIGPLLNRSALVHFPSDARHAAFSVPLAVPAIATMNDYFNAVVNWRPASVRKYYQDWPARYCAYHMARLGERRTLRRLSHIIGISDAVGRIVGPAYSVPADRFTTVRYGIDFSAIPPNDGVIRFPKTILFVGGNFQRKGLLVLLQAAPAVLAKHPDTRIIVIGKSNYARGCQRLARDLGVAGNCDFLGAVDHSRLVDYYASSTILTMPSLIEAFGIPYLEAMSCGLPVVATSCAGPDEYLIDEENALVVPPGDSESLAGALIRLLNDTALRSRLREGGTETAKSFTPERMAQETLAVYRKVLSGGRGEGEIRP
jgi:glycosyltransferase involved in cell wall biosynthesis